MQGQRDASFRARLSECPFTYICLRENHEERARKVMGMYPGNWEIRRKYGGEIYVEKEYTQLEYLSDIPAVYEFCDYKMLSLPGAYGIDKWYRLMHGWPWFEGEMLTEEEREVGRQLKAKERPFDLVISNTCPIDYEPTDLFLDGINQTLVDKTMERYLGEIEHAVEVGEFMRMKEGEESLS